MKYLLKNTSLFLVLAIVLSGFTACTKSANSAQQTGNESVSTSNSAANDPQQQTSKSEYPPIPSAMATAEIKNLDQSTFNLEGKKGNVVLVNLWATWCGPCRGEMPHLIEMQENYGNKNFEIIGLNTDDESVEDINRFVEQMKLNYKIAYADGALMRELVNISKFQGIPQSFLIDREGRLRGVFLGGGKKVITTMKETVEKVVNE